MSRLGGSKWRYPVKTSDGQNDHLYEKWSGIRKRCKIGGIAQSRCPSYIGCTYSPEWESYDEFCGWAMQQVGHNLLDEAGSRFPIDKDILFKGNKTYSPETCVFVPREINAFYTSRQRFRGDCPKGVYFKKSHQQYVAQVALGQGFQKHLGIYDTVEEAFSKYRAAKIEYARVLAIKYIGLVDNRVIDALNNYEVDVND